MANVSRGTVVLSATGSSKGGASVGPAHLGPAGGVIGDLKEDDAAAIATRTWIFGFPLMATHLTQRVRTNTAAQATSLAPLGNLFFARSMPDATPSPTTPVMPNHDTLYMSGWFELAEGAYRLDLPDMDGRYFMMPLLDAWQNVFAEIGSRATGSRPRSFLLAGPGWRGPIPADVTVLRSPTDLAHLVGRIYCSGERDDVKKVNALQDAIKVIPLDQMGAPRDVPTPSIDLAVDMITPVRDQIYAMDADSYFTLLAELMTGSPPAVADAPMVAEMAKIGLAAGRPFEPAALSPVIHRGLTRAPAAGKAQLAVVEKRLAGTVNGWTILSDVGKYGVDYERRAAHAAIGLAIRPDRAQLLHAAGMTYWSRDAAYFATETDADGAQLTGAKRHVIRFRPGQLPKADGYWALSAFGPDYFFVPNRLDRFALGGRDKFQYNPDGSVDIYLQAESPGGAAEANWLPVPRDKFALMIRIYGPAQPSALAEGWLPPYVECRDEI